MKINQNRPDTQKVPVNTINTMMEQISDLQTDVAGLQNEVDGLGQSIDTVNIEATQAQIADVNATNISSTNATINNITASVGVNTANLDANTADIDTATIGTETVGTSTITDATIATANITDLDAVNGSVQHLSTDSIEANSLDADAITTKGITNSGNYTGKNVTVENVTASDTINAKNLNVIDTVSVADINITGQVTGLSDIEADSITVDEIKADTAEIQSIENHSIYTDTLHPLVPSPSLVSDSDRYTIELPTFAGTIVLTWKEGNLIKWTATVIGNGVDYGITFGCTEDQVYINELFQWNKKLYIRHSANGQLLYSYNAEKELDPITIYYNMGAWTNPKSLEELTEEDYYYQVVRASGTVLFGKTIIPRLDDGDENNGTFNFKGSRKLNELPTLSQSDVGDVWNITEETYTDNRFVEGAGKPINAGDDVVAVLQEVTGSEIEDDTFFVEPDFSGYDNHTYYKTFFRLSNGKTLCFVSMEYSNSGDYNSKILVYEYVSPNSWQLVNTLSEVHSTNNEILLVNKITETENGVLIIFARTNPYTYEQGCTYWRSTDNGGTYTQLFLSSSVTYGTPDLMNISTSGSNIAFCSPERNSDYYSACVSADDGLTWSEIDDYGLVTTVGLPNGVIGLIDTMGEVYTSSDMVNWSSLCTIQYAYTSSAYYVGDNNVLFIDNDRICIEELSNDTQYQLVHEFSDTVEAPAIISNGNRLVTNDFYYSDNNGLAWSKLQDIENDNWATSFVFTDDDSLIFSKDDLYQSSDDKFMFYYNVLSGKTLRWDKLSAGVNYENFVAEKITATESLKSEGTLEVDGTSQFDGNVNVDADLTADKVITPDLEVTNTLTANSTGINATKNITHTGNYTATGSQTITGNLNRTGNETITGVVVIGDLD